MWNCFSLLTGTVILLLDRFEYLKLYTNASRIVKLQTSPIIFITDIAAIASIIYFFLGFLIQLYEFFGSDRQGDSKFFRNLKIFYKKNLPFMLILNSTVCFCYWGLFFYDKNLLSPKMNDTSYTAPFWKNFNDHSIGLLVTILEIIYHNFELALYTPIITGCVTITYYIDILIYNHLYGIWPYQLFIKLSKPMVFVYCIGFLFVGSMVALIILRVIRCFKKPGRKENQTNGIV